MCKLDADIFEEINEDTKRKMRNLKDKTEDAMKDVDRTGLKL